MAYTVECMEDLGSFHIGEGPHWDVETQSLYFVDVGQCTVHKYVPSNKQHTSLKLENMVSFVIPIEGFSNKFVVGMANEINIITWDGVSDKLSSIEPYTKLENTGTIINDAKADSCGHLWTGTVAVHYDFNTFTPSIGCLYSLSSDKKFITHASTVGVSNGISFSNDLKKLYYIDSALRTVDQFDYNVNDQTVSNRKTLFTVEKHGLEGIPDGQAIDRDGNLWVALFSGSSVIKIGTDKPETLLYTVDIPEQQVTSVTFGGPELDELYVTTAGYKFAAFNNDKPLKGHLYKVTNLGIKGMAGCKVNVQNV